MGGTLGLRERESNLDAEALCKRFFSAFDLSMEFGDNIFGRSGVASGHCRDSGPSFGNCLKLRGTDGYQNRALDPQETIIGP
jgi:hypothetical protein